MKFFKKNHHLTAVCNGRCAPLSDIPDEVFASGMLGVGVAIHPTGDHFCCPVGGTVQSVADSQHAYTILSEDGPELLIHIGVDTVQLRGEGFNPLVLPGQRVRAGDPLADVDLQKITDRGLSTVTAVLITNHEDIEILEYGYGQVAGGKTPILTYRTAKKG